MQVPCLSDLHFIHVWMSRAWNSVCILLLLLFLISGCWIGWSNRCLSTFVKKFCQENRAYFLKFCISSILKHFLCQINPVQYLLWVQNNCSVPIATLGRAQAVWLKSEWIPKNLWLKKIYIEPISIIWPSWQYDKFPATLLCPGNMETMTSAKKEQQFLENTNFYHWKNKGNDALPDGLAG